MNKEKIIPLIFIVVLGIFVLTRPDNTRNQTFEKTSLNNSISKIYDATVLIETYSGGSLKSNGSGFFYKKDNKYAYIITNYHVLVENDVEVVTSKDERVKAEVLGKDEYLDLAVLRVDKKYASLVATINSSKNSLVGDTVFTVGSPRGYKNTVTTGIISGKDRLVKVEVNNEDWLMKVIQIDASIKEGNSGGPLLNINGEVIGIVSLELDGMGFAIPIEYVENYIKFLEENKKVEYPTLGVKITESNDTSTLLKNNIDINQEDGIIVLEDKNNLKKGDLIIKVNEKEVKDILTLKTELLSYKSNDKVKLTLIRNNIKRFIKVTLS